jgi:hypothetical protein
MSSAAKIAATAASPTTRAAIAIAQSVRARRQRIGLRPAKPICCRSAISTWSSRCPAEISPIAYQNKAVLYDLLLRTAAETLLTIAADPKRLGFFGEIEGLCRREAFAAYLAPLMRKKWFVYAKPPFAGPEAVLAYLARYTHRVAISNSRLVALDGRGVTFQYKDYRRNGQAHYRTLTLSPDEFIRRFLLHVLPKGFHRIRHYGLLANAGCKANVARAKELLAVPMPAAMPPAADDTVDPDAMTDHRPPCPCCGGRMIIVEVFARGSAPRGPPSPGAGIRI